MSGSVRGVLCVDWDALRALGERAEQGHLPYGDLALVGLLVTCSDPQRRSGSTCPDRLCPGTLYDTRTPNRFLQFTGQPPVAATRFDQVVMRCSACQYRHEAPLPDGIAPERWTASADVSIVMARYAAGVPFYRLAKLQAAFGIPLSEGALWDRVLEVAEAVRPVDEHLSELAARADLLHCDDTPVRIVTLIAENKKRNEEPGRTPKKGERVAMQTSAILALTDGRWIVRYASGRDHAGDNVGKLLARRPPDLGPPVQMADALAANFAHGHTVERANCLAHARRNFVDVESSFPDACAHVLDAIAVAVTRSN